MVSFKKGLFIFSIACSFAFLSIFLQVSPISTSSYLEKSYLFDSSQIANLSAFYFLAYAIFQIPNGVFLDKFGIKRLLPVGVLITLIGNFLYMVSTDSLAIAGSRFIIGLGCSIAYIGAVFVACKVFKPKYLPLCIAIVEMVSTLGAILAQNTYLSLILKFGWIFSNFVIILFTLIILLLSLVVLKGFTFSINKSHSVSWLVLFFRIKNLLKNQRLLGIFAYSFFSWGLIMGFAGYWAKQYYENMHHFTQVRSLDFAEIYWLSFIVSALFISFFAKSEKAIKFMVILLACIGAVSLILMSIPILFNVFELIIFSIFAGFSASGVVLAFSLIPYFVEENIIGTAVALNNTFIVLGGFFVQVAFGIVIYLPIHGGQFFFDKGIDFSYYKGMLFLALFAIAALMSIIITVLKKN